MEAPDLTEIRIAKNQATFRAANDNIEAAAGQIGVDGDLPFICECAEPTCTDIVRIAPAVYKDVRRHPRLFFSIPGHEATDVHAGIGRIVERRDGYVLVEKTGIAGEIAEREA